MVKRGSPPSSYTTLDYSSVRLALVLIVFSLIFPLIVLAEESDELKFGYYTDRVVVSTQTILFDETLNKRVDEIGQKIVSVLDKRDLTYTFRIVNDPTINAYSAAGGFVYINTGLLDILETEDELAAVMAHELVHTNKSHQVAFIRSANRKIIIGQITGTIFGVLLGVAMDSALPNDAYSSYPYGESFGSRIVSFAFQFGQGLGGIMAVSMIKGYGKKQELEADALAVRYMKKAGYDPYALISVLKRLMSVRDRLKITEKNYISSLINAEPGLESRLTSAEDFLLGK